MKTIISLIILTGWALLGYWTIASAPVVVWPEAIHIDLSQTDKILLIGPQELGQRKGSRAAERRHLLFHHSDDGWEMANIARFRKVDARTNRRATVFLKRWRLESGDVIRLGPDQVPIRVTQTSPDLVLTQDDRQVRWQKGRLTPHEEYIHLPCRSVWWRLKNRIRWWFTPPDGREIELFSLGGSVNGPDRWRIDGVKIPRSARILWLNGAFWLAPCQPDIPVTMARDGHKYGFHQLFMPFKKDGEIVNRLILGRTYYDVNFLTRSNKLQLTPRYGQDVWPSTEGYPTPHDKRVAFSQLSDQTKTWIGKGRSVMDWLASSYYILLAAGVFAMLMCHFVLRFARSHRLASESALSSVIFLFPACFFIPLTLFWASKLVLTDIAMLFVLTWAAWTWSSLYLILKNPSMNKAGWVWPTILFMVAAGCMVMTQLASGALNTRWLIYARKHLLVMAGLGWLMIPFWVVSARRLKEAWIGFVMESAWPWRALRLILFLGLILFLFLQLAKGGELGLWGIQPTEAAKFGLALLAGFVGMHLAVLRGLYSEAYQQSPAAYLFNFLRVLILLGLSAVFVLVGVRDISPLLIMMVFIITWVWNVAPHPWEQMLVNQPAHSSKRLPGEMRRAKYIIRGGLILILGVSLIVGARFYQNAEKLPDWIPQKDRIQVWANPTGHPHSGDQVIEAMRLAGLGGWFGANETPFGLNGQIMQLPVVQNDFIGSFILYKYGGAAALALILFQLFYVVVLFYTSDKCLQWAAQTGYYKNKGAGLVLSAALSGLAWMHIAQFGIAWGNALGVIPVMGQPMTWVSAATSHILFFGAPTLILALVGGRIVQAD